MDITPAKSVIVQLLGVKGSQVQILSSRQRNSRSKPVQSRKTPLRKTPEGRLFVRYEPVFSRVIFGLSNGISNGTKENTQVAGVSERRSFGYVRQLPSGRFHASYVDPETSQRVKAPSTFERLGD